MTWCITDKGCRLFRFFWHVAHWISNSQSNWFSEMLCTVFLVSVWIFRFSSFYSLTVLFRLDKSTFRIRQRHVYLVGGILRSTRWKFSNTFHWVEMQMKYCFFSVLNQNLCAILPLLLCRSNLSLSPEESWLPVASILFCIVHVQVNTHDHYICLSKSLFLL